MTVRFFIRNDDVWALDREFRLFFDLALDHRIPIVYAVIPAKMQEKLVRFLRQAKERNPQLVDIVQHGWMHTNYASGGQKYEFGAFRSLKVQREDIRRGLEKMRLAFGEYFTPAFVPPYHGYDERTLTILENEGFKIFSAARGQLSSRRLMHLPVSISLTCYGGPQKTILETKVVLAQLVQNAKRRVVSGIVTHHRDFSSSRDKKELKKFFGCMRRLMATEGWRPILFSDMVTKK